jgi:voltage-dependent calcium channel L type alpha-1D
MSEKLGSDFESYENDTFINYGVLTFDHIGKALLTIFQILTNDNWALTMYNLMLVDWPILAPIFLCVLVIFGSFFIMNIILAVILDAFIRVQQDELRTKFLVDNFGDTNQTAKF